GIDAEEVVAGANRHDDLFQGTVARSFANAVDGALDLARPFFYRGETVGHCQPKVIVTVHAQDRFVDVRNVVAEVADDLGELGRDAIADGVGDVDGRRPRVDGGLHNLT